MSSAPPNTLTRITTSSRATHELSHLAGPKQAVMQHTHPAVIGGMVLLADSLHVTVSELPTVVLLRTASGHSWHLLVDGKLAQTTHAEARNHVLHRGGGNAANALSAAPTPLAPPNFVSTAMAERVVKGIHRYYGGQVLEPSTQGFLSIIEKSFPRSDL